MSKFNITNKIKDNFEENLEDFKKFFKESKSALNNFDNYMSSSPKMIIGLSTASLIAIGSLGYDTFKPKVDHEISLDLYNPNVTDVKLRGAQLTDEFLRIPAKSAAIRNRKYNDDVDELENNSSEMIKNSTADQPHVFKNPFWANNIITVFNKPNSNSQYYQEPFVPNKTLDISHHVIDMDYNQIKKIGEIMGIGQDKQYLVDSYSLYHEAAHASYAQSIPYAGMTTNRMDNELMSDISSLVYMGNQNKKDFNYLIDKVIDYRMNGLTKDGERASFMHNPVYGLIELKKAVQKDPSLLDMKPENIAQFSDMFVKELKSVNLSQHHEKSLKDFHYPSVKTIANDITQNNKEDFYKTVTFYHLYNGGEQNEYNRVELPKVNEWFKPESIKMLSEDIAKTLQTHLRYDTLATTMLDNSNNDPKLAVKRLTEMVDNKPALKDDFIQAIKKGNLFYMEELKVNIEPVKKIEEEVKKENLRKLEQQNENNLKRKVQLQKPSMNNNTKT